MTPEVYDKIKAEVKRRLSLTSNQVIENKTQYEKLWTKTVASYMFCDISASKFKVSTNTACHAGMNQSAGYDYVVDVIQRTKTIDQYDDKHGEMFLDYLMNRSPFAEVFIYKNAKQALVDGFTVRDLNLPANWVVCSLILTRALWLDYQNNIVKSFGTLVDAGLNEDMALLFSGYLPIKNNMGVVNFNYGHCWWDAGYVNLDYMVNFINGTKTILTGTCREGASYSGGGQGVNRLFCGNSKTRVLDWLEESISLIVNSTSKENNNPFAKAQKLEKNYFPKDACIEAAVEIGNKFYKENKL